MATGPRVSVIMSVHNGAQFLYPAVRSILDQHFSDFEFLILDDGSTDNSLKILSALAKADSRVHIIASENQGLVASLNQLIGLARAPYLARMDCDDIVMPDRFLRQLAFLEANPEIGILGSNSHDIDARGNLIGATDKYPETPEALVLQLADGPPLCHPSVMMRTHVARQLGGYRPAFRHAEDYDLWLRATRLTQIANLPDRLLLYRRSPDQVSKKYAHEQAKAAAIAWEDHIRCSEGYPTLFNDCITLPDIDNLDTLFEKPGVANNVRRKIVERLRYSPEMLEGPEFQIMMKQVSSGSGFEGAGRTILRLGRKGRVLRAVSLAAVMTGLLISSS